MFEWYWILIIIATLVIVYAFIQVILFFIMRKCMKKAFSELDKMAIYEKDRFGIIFVSYKEIISKKKIENVEINNLIKEQENISNNKEIEMESFKSKNDFIIMYLMKFLEEKKLKNKDDFSSIYQNLKDISYFDINDKTSPYIKYNKVANRYNALANICIISNSFKRSSYLRAPIL